MQQTESENELKKPIQLQRMYIEIILCILLIQNFMIRNSLATSIVKELNPSHCKKKSLQRTIYNKKEFMPNNV